MNGAPAASAALDSPAAAAAGLVARLTAAWLDVASHAVTVGARYWSEALARGATPIDVLDDAATFMRIAQGRREPTWASPNALVARTPVAALRDFTPAGTRPGAPAALILPPQAGHHSCIVDYSERQSQVAVAIGAGLERLYVLEWLEATRETAGVSIDDYVHAVRDAVERIGEPVHLIGDCQGGWLASIFAALEPGLVRSLAVGAAPIDFHAGESPLLDYISLLSSLHVSPYRSVVEAGGGVLRGEVQLAGFVALAPEEELKKHLDLVLSLRDPEFVRRYAEFEDWFKHTQDISGAFYLWIVEHLFTRNELVQGTLEVEGRRVDLREIDCPVTILAGSRDHITPAEQAFALADHVGTPPEQVRCELVDAGHLGLFMGRAPLRDHWAPLLRDVAGAHAAA
jgi:poly(3-hydroxyalkanoate) synthetase